MTKVKTIMIDTNLHTRLKKYCKDNAYMMNAYIEKIIVNHLNEKQNEQD